MGAGAALRDHSMNPGLALFCVFLRLSVGQRLLFFGGGAAVGRR